MPVQTVIKLRRDTAANWDTTNPVLAAGEMGIETDTGLHKFGNGTDAWGALPYAAASRMLQQVKNASGSSMPKGSVVYISGATGGDALVALADADSEATSSKTLGFLASAIADGAYGNVIEAGLLSGLNTSTATAGQSVWLSSTAGGFVFGAPPAKPAHSVYLGVVTRVHATEGEVLVKVQNGYELNELHDVNASSPSTNDVLQWNGTEWVNSPVAISEVSGLGTGVATFLATPSSANLRAAVTSETGSGNLVFSDAPVFGASIQVLGATANISMGRTDGTSATPYIDFNSGSTAVDYDARIIATGGNGTAGNGTVQILAGSVILPATTTIGSVSSTELGYLDGVTSAIQTQLNGKAASSHTHAMADLTSFEITSATEGQTLVYNSSTGKWVNGAAAATGETISSFLLMGA